MHQRPSASETREDDFGSATEANRANGKLHFPREEDSVDNSLQIGACVSWTAQIPDSN